MRVKAIILLRLLRPYVLNRDFWKASLNVCIAITLLKTNQFKMSAHKIATKTCIFYENWNRFKMGAPVWTLSTQRNVAFLLSYCCRRRVACEAKSTRMWCVLITLTCFGLMTQYILFLVYWIIQKILFMSFQQRSVFFLIQSVFDAKEIYGNVLNTGIFRCWT